MTFNWSKEEVASLALKSPKATVLLDAVEWVLSLESLDSLEVSASLAVSAIDDVIAVSAIALGEGEVVALATFTFFEGSVNECIATYKCNSVRNNYRFQVATTRKRIIADTGHIVTNN